MRALVTGASGFIGSTLVEELCSRGYQVRALMRARSSSEHLMGQQYERASGDLSDRDSLLAAVQGVDVVFHLAGATVARSRRDFFEANTAGTARLAQAVATAAPGLKRLVYVSSLAAAGPAQSLRARVETERDQPVSAYGESKLQAEQELLRHCAKFPISIVRPPLVYGPRDRATLLFFQTIAKNVLPVLKGRTADGHKYYSAIHVRDLCQGLVLAAEGQGVRSGEVFFLADDGMVTFEGMFSEIARALGKKPRRLAVPRMALRLLAAGGSVASALARKPVPLNLDKLQEILPDYWICSNQKAKRLLGFDPQYDLARGIAETAEWYVRNEWLSA